ncbi:MmgE/PrpD family protein [Chelatococcus asaccharovorans]|uniref:MmgE/PrpD family protein n=1 Tax=Chelatococcus asaccharovorans TaxID=28210 RepID=UPI00224C733F|nr:MmgE/PrpD family protein [Chelatococcus asaccharovorans]CAH1654160.1 2-methylcitrate dehydratase PrpD [Chelatococcus asaccharovorans]CAH1694537.1 2-methylcitrate dehydratase PrpD [Chelatococcus asaccharovorans]
MADIASIHDIRADGDFAADYAAFASALTLDQMPQAVVAAAKANLFDTLACATAGVSAAGVGNLKALVAEWAGKPEAGIWCSSIRVPAHHAAWVNGMMAHARDYDDTHDGAVLHAGVSVIPAALAAAELNPDATGADLIAGVVAGLELICRLGVATSIGIIESGFMYTSLFGHFAATAAAGRVAGLDRDQMVNALGVAYSQAAGTHQVTRDAALTKRVQPGFAAKTGLISVALTKAGIRGAQNTFEGIDGLFRSYLRGRYDPDALRDGLGERYEFLNLSYKPYPCCRFNHTAIDAALIIRRELEARGATVHALTARVNKQAYEAVCTPVAVRKRPATIVQAQFSLPYTVACALHKGAVGLRAFTEEGLRDEDVLAIASRVNAELDAEIERNWSRNISPTHLIAATDKGLIEARVDIPRGHPKSPMSLADFDAKLADCLGISGLDWPETAVTTLRQTIDGLHEMRRGGAILEAVTR